MIGFDIHASKLEARQLDSVKTGKATICIDCMVGIIKAIKCVSFGIHTHFVIHYHLPYDYSAGISFSHYEVPHCITL